MNWMDPATWGPEYWLSRFGKEHEAALVCYTGNQPPSDHNMAKRTEFLSVPDLTFQSVIEATRLEYFFQADREVSIINLISNDEKEAPAKKKSQSAPSGEEEDAAGTIGDTNKIA
jgi:hypothetical protein